MTIYKRTEIPFVLYDRLVKQYVSSYIYKLKRWINRKQRLYLAKTYHSNIQEICDAICQYLRVEQITKKIVYIYLIRTYVNGNLLDDIVGFLNYGNFEVKGNLCVQRYIIDCLYKIELDVEGLV